MNKYFLFDLSEYCEIFVNMITNIFDFAFTPTLLYSWQGPETICQFLV